MTTKLYDVTGIGNAIVDVLSYTENAFIDTHALPKGGMTLISEEESKKLYAAMGPATECSGGSVANTIATISALGGKAAFIGKVFDDQLGTAFRHDMKAIGVHYDTPATSLGKSTAVCMILVTPDAQRTMATYIGASAYVSPNDVNTNLIAQTKILYLEGYLWYEPETKNALRKAAKAAQENSTKVAFSLSDGFCVHNHREEFLTLIRDHVDILFANEEEAMALTQTTDFEAAKAALKPLVETAAITRGAKGSTLFNANEEVTVKAVTYGDVTDTTGAGDAYAAGVLYGLTHNYSLTHSGELASRLAGHIIAQLGARSQKPILHLLDDKKAA